MLSSERDLGHGRVQPTGSHKYSSQLANLLCVQFSRIRKSTPIFPRLYYISQMHGSLSLVCFVVYISKRFYSAITWLFLVWRQNFIMRLASIWFCNCTFHTIIQRWYSGW
jgi:hypothetical protein